MLKSLITSRIISSSLICSNQAQNLNTIFSNCCKSSSEFCNLQKFYHTSSPCFAKEIEMEEEGMGKGDKIFRRKLPTTRLDAVLKAGLNLSRSKVEKVFYDDRVRLNGQRAKKKSQIMNEGDEVDVVRGPNKINPLFIDVSRVEIVEIGGNTEIRTSKSEDDYDYGSDSDDESAKTSIVLKRYKNLTIENYPTPWKGSVMDDK